MITVTQSLSGSYLTSGLPDVAFSITGEKAAVVMTLDGKQIYSETLYPVSGSITLTSLDTLLEAYVRSLLTASLVLTITEQDADGSTVSTSTLSATIIYCRTDFRTGTDAVTASSFTSSHFLSTLMGAKTTALGRLEYLHYLGTDTASVTAEYADGSTATFTPSTVAGNSKYTTIDVSPSRFTGGKTLVAFTATAGSRSQRFLIDPACPDCAPILLFTNSFGVDELIYCTGKHKVSPTYTRSTAYINGKKTNYKIVEERKFSADTGPLSVAEQNWADELFRSDSVRVVNIYGGVPTVGKYVAITGSKSEVTNEDDALSRFTFDYIYSQPNHNVSDISRSGRIFDNTFDNTFN